MQYSMLGWRRMPRRGRPAGPLREWSDAITAVSLALGMTLSLTSCVASVTGEARRAGYLVIALQEAPDALDPTTASSFVGRMVFANMCEKLYDVDARLNLVPQLAAALPEITDGGLTYTIPLRPNVLFDDGTPLTADAVVRSLLRHKTDKLSQRTAELATVASVQAVGPLAVQVRLARPFAPLTSVLADRAGMVLSAAALDRYGANFGQHPVCVGPFSFESRPSPDEINLVRSPYYYDRDAVHLPGITFRAVPEANVRAADLRAGDVDVVDRASPQDLTSLRDDPSLTVRTVTSLGYQGIDINIGNANGATKPPAVPDLPLSRHPELRKAFELSLDRDVINKVVFNGAHVPDCSPIPPDSPYRVPVTCTRRDIAQAKALVAAAGVPTPVPVTLMVQNSAVYEQLGTIIQAMAKDAGFAVTVQPTEFATALSRGTAGKFEAFQVGWSGRLDPDQNISSMVLPGSALNYTGTHDQRITDLVNAARGTTDQAQRRQLYGQLVDALNQELGIIYLYHERYLLGVRNDVSGVDFYGDGLIRLKTAQLHRRAD
jgi:peptide/nickel transport system substrate-binding protein